MPSYCNTLIQSYSNIVVSNHNIEYGAFEFIDSVIIWGGNAVS